MATRFRHFATAFLLGAVVFISDILSKTIFFAAAETNPTGFLIAHKNYGISFNIPLPLWLTVCIAIGALIWAVWSLSKLQTSSFKLQALFLGIFMGGVIGNVFDRITLGYVRDWLLLFGRSAVNLADGAILVGLVGYFLLTKQPKKGTE